MASTGLRRLRRRPPFRSSDLYLPLILLFSPFPRQSSTPPMAMYIRVKRKKTTYFVHCDPSETILQIKAKLQILTDNPIRNQRLILVESHLVLDDARTLAQQKVENDAVLAMTLRKRNGEWEDINIEKSSHHSAYDSDSS